MNNSKVTNGNYIIDLNLLFAAVANFAVCKNCGMNSIQFYEDSTNRVGLAVRFVFECMNCGAKHAFYSSKGDKKNIFILMLGLCMVCALLGKVKLQDKHFVL